MKINFLIKALIPTLIILSPASAFGQTWHVVGSGGDNGDLSVWFIDADSIRSVGDKKQVWIKVINQKPSVGRDRYVALNRVDCQADSVLELQVSTYFGKSPVGDVPPMALKYPTPGSTLDSVLQVTCGRKKSLFPVNDADAFAALMFKQ
jgi:hypothetical protein